MRESDFNCKIEALHQQVDDLQRHAAEGSAQLQVVLPEVFEALQNTLEELRIAGEESCQQNDELTSASQAAGYTRMEGVLRKSDERYRALFEGATDAIYITAREGKVLDVNQAMLDLFGYTRAEMIGADVRRLYVHPADREKFQQEIEREEAVRDYAVKFRKKDGAEIDCLLTSMVWRATDGSVLGYQGIIRDITKQKRTEEMLAQERYLLYTLMDNVPDHVYFKDTESRFLRISKAHAEWFGLSDTFEAVGKTDFDFFSAQHAQQAYADEQQVMQTGQPLVGKEEKETWPNGRETWVSTTKMLLRDADGQIIGTFGISRDITKRVRLEKALQKAHGELEKQVEERTADLRTTNESLRREIAERKRAEELAKVQGQQLIQADKMASLGILVSGVAHEIHNPNYSITLNADIMSRVWHDVMPILNRYYQENGEFLLAGIPYTQADEKLAPLIKGISQSAKRIQKIVQSLRDFARRDAGQLTDRVNVNSVVEAATFILSNQIRKLTDRFAVESSDNLPTIRGNAQQLEQVLINLISNACQALNDKAKSVVVKTSYDEQRNRILIAVRDEGAGIPPEYLNRITEPFFTTKQNQGGTGLGLSVSYGIVEAHGGELNFTSEFGKGTTATVILPVAG